MNFTACLLCSLVVTTLFSSSCGLECYVCKEQDANDGKCLKTIKTCEQEHDRCLTEIRWGTTPYWQAGAQKQFYVSKRCATQSQCERTMKKFTTSCTHVWYEDWKCAECCGGDKCNYFIISGGEKVNKSLWLLCVFLLFIPSWNMS